MSKAKKQDSEKVVSLFDTPLKQKRYETGIDIWRKGGKAQDAAFQHSVLCQTSFPYRNPGNDLKIWEHSQGRASLNIQCLQEKNPKTGEFMYLGLPYGTKARLIMAYLNTQAIKSQSPIIDVESSITAFIQQIGLAKKGKNVNDVKEQLARIASSIITLTYQADEEHSLNARFALVKKYDLWFPKDEKQKVLWTSRIQLTDDYFNELEKHAVPLDERALGALKNSSMGLDIYCWLAQRLHRIPHGKKQFVSWQNLKDQFGAGYGSMRKFKQVFRHTLGIVHTQYLTARIQEDTNKGFYLENSPSPIEKKTMILLGDSKPKA